MNERRTVLLLAVSLIACGESRPPSSSTTTHLTDIRIVSIGASVTETLFALGLGDKVVAVDRTSVYPEATAALPGVGLPGQLSVEGVAAQRPTLIIADGSGHGVPGGADAALSQLEGLGIRVARLGPAPKTLEEAIQRLVEIGQAVNRVDEARSLARRVKEKVDEALAKVPTGPRPRALFVYARGHRTLLVSGTDTPAHALLSMAGADNAVTSFSDFKPMSAETVIASAPDVIVIPSRGLSSLGGIDGLLALPGLSDTPAGRAKRVIAIDDLELLTFGPRLGQGLDKLVTALHPTIPAAVVTP